MIITVIRIFLLFLASYKQSGLPSLGFFPPITKKYMLQTG